MPRISAPETWREVFAFCQEVSATFDADGKPVAVRHPVTPPPPASSDAPAPPPFDPDAEAAHRASGGDPARAAAFLAWLAGESSEPGETVLVAGTDLGCVYVLSEHGAAARCLKRFDMATGQAECLTPPDDPRELVGPLFVPGEDGESRLAGLVWRSPEGNRTEWRDPDMAAFQARLEEAFSGAGFDWFGPAPGHPDRWIACARRPDRPPVWLFADAAARLWRVLAECAVPVSPTERTLFRWTASDGMPLTGVFTRPANPGPFPLVVFPHGGPGALSATAFDERAWALAGAGFAVFQPNYRGSAGFGKEFRFAGWGPDGIRRALLDVREGVSALFAAPGARLDGVPPVLLGGSWGGYVALAELAFFPGEWSGAVSFFGAFDLPALLRDEWARVGIAESPAEVDRSRASLRRQFGDPENPGEMAVLAAISPLHRIDAIRAPVILFHNRGDRIIPFAQSERMHEAMSRRGLPVLFRAADGDHGWSPAEEADLYASLASVFRGWMAASAQVGGRAVPDSMSRAAAARSSRRRVPRRRRIW